MTSRDDGVVNRGLQLLLACAVVACAAACSAPSKGPEQMQTVETPFAAGGRIGVQIESGDCDVVKSADERIRVTLRGNIGKATGDINLNGQDASVLVKNTPHNNFNCAIEVPAAEELRVSMRGGSLKVADLATATEVENVGGDVAITVGDPSEYGSVDASVGAGDLSAGPFGSSQSGIGSHLTWSGTGKRRLTAHVGAGDLKLRK